MIPRIEVVEYDGGIFDFDGVIINSMREVYRGACHVFTQSGLKPPVYLDFYCNFRQPYMDYYRRMGVTASEQQVRKWYFARAHNENAPLFHGAKNVIKTLNAMDFPLAIVSTHPTHLISQKLAQEGLEGCFASVFGMAKDKVNPLLATCSRLDIRPDRTFYVGDMMSDMEDANAAGLISIGIDNGCGTTSRLVNAGARHVIGRLNQIFQVIYNGIDRYELPAIRTC